MAHSHVAQFGVAGMTIDDMAAELGVSKGSFYAHFTNRDDLLAAVIDDVLAHERERSLKHTDGLNGDAGARLRHHLNEAVADDEHSQVLAQFIGDRTSQLVATAARELSDLHLETFQRLLESTGLTPQAATSRSRVLHAAFTGYWLSSSADATSARALTELLYADATK